MFKKIISVILSVACFGLFLSSFTIETLAYIQCTEKLKQELQSQVDRYEVLSNLPSQQEAKNQVQSKINQIKNQKTVNLENNLDIKIKKLAVEQIQSEFQKLSLPNTNIDLGLNIENVSQKGGKLSGLITEDRIYNYDDGEFGSSTNKYDFVYNTKDSSLILNKQPEFNLAAEKTIEPNIPDAKKQEIIEQKKLKNKDIPSVSKEEQVKDLKRDKKAEYQNKVKQFKNNLANAGCSVMAKSAGTYNRSSTVIYARYYAKSRASNFPDYKNQDCTNFASQSVWYGGLNMDHGAVFYDSSWYANSINGSFSSLTVTPSWRVVGNFANHMYWNEDTGTWLEFDASGYGIFYPLQIGDLLFADWNRDNIWDHTMIITGWDKINDQWEPKLTYHSSDQLDIKFADMKTNAINFGYKNPKFKGIRIYSVW